MRRGCPPKWSPARRWLLECFTRAPQSEREGGSGAGARRRGRSSRGRARSGGGGVRDRRQVQQAGDRDRLARRRRRRRRRRRPGPGVGGLRTGVGPRQGRRAVGRRDRSHQRRRRVRGRRARARALRGRRAATVPVWKSKFYGAFVLNHRVVLHAIDATPARWRGHVGSSPLDGASAATSSPRNDLVENYRVHSTHWLISTQVVIRSRG